MNMTISARRTGIRMFKMHVFIANPICVMYGLVVDVNKSILSIVVEAHFVLYIGVMIEQIHSALAYSNRLIEFVLDRN